MPLAVRLSLTAWCKKNRGPVRRSLTALRCGKAAKLHSIRQLDTTFKGRIIAGLDVSKGKAMENPGERLVGDYLRHIRGCD
jgi:hypothetical protein